MVLDRSPNIHTIVNEKANEDDTNPQIAIINPLPPIIPISLFLILNFGNPYQNNTGFTMPDDNDDTYYSEYYDYPPFNYALEEAYDKYISYAGHWNDPFYDVRKQATRDREKKQTKRQKHRATKLTKKANAIQEKQERHTKHEKPHPPKKSGRRGSLGRDIVLV